MFAPRKILWRIKCASDPRWNAEGESEGFVTIRPKEVENHIEKCKKQYGEIPDDCFYSCMKD